jgi:hypothetical protein
MKLRTTLFICLPLLAIVACKGKSKKNSSDIAPPVAPTLSGDQTPVKPGTETPAGVVTNPSQSAGNVNQSGGKGSEPVKGAVECETFVLDFEKKPDGTAFDKGEKLKYQYEAYGVEFVAHKRLNNGDMENNVTPILFDTAERPNEEAKLEYSRIDNLFGNNNGFDWDLTTDHNGKAMIIAEHMYDVDPNDSRDFVTNPDDNANGGVLKLFFAKPTALVSMDLIDVESKDSNIELYNKVGTDYVRKTVQPIPAMKDGAVQTLSVDDHSYVNKLMINLAGSGAVDNIKICVKK